MLLRSYDVPPPCTNMRQVDFEKVAQKVGITYARNARSAFKKIWDKLKVDTGDGPADDADDEATDKTTPKKAKANSKRSLVKQEFSGDEEAEQAVLKKKAKPTTKKAGGQRKAEKKTPAKPKRVTEVEKEIKKEGEGGDPDLPMAEAEEFSDKSGDVSEYHDPDEIEDNPNIPTEADKAVNGDHENDAEYAAMLGISVEQYRELAQQAQLARQSGGVLRAPVSRNEDEA